MSSESAQHVLVSVLMPVYRPYLPWLEQAITSLLNQSNPSWRLVLSLDGDDPDTKAAAELALRLLNAKQKLIVVEGARSGISNALNRGLVHCKTPFTARLDADDICTPERFASQTAALETNPDLVAVGMQIQGIDHNSKPVLERLHRYPSTPKATLLMGALINTPIAHPVLMMRSDAARALKGYRNQPCMEDYDLLARLSGHGQLSNLKGLGLLYRLHPRQHSRHVRPLRHQLLAARKRFLHQSYHQTPWHRLLTPIPYILYLLGPTLEYSCRRLCLAMAARFQVQIHR